MTLVAAWIRQLGTRDELVVASDSRLSFGARWDCCPKIFPLQRNDSLLAFAGDTAFAYPVLLQLEKSILNYRKSLSRELDILDLRPHFLKIIERMRAEVGGLPKGNHGIDSRDFQILFAGYSHRAKTFQAWALRFDEIMGRFHFAPLTFHHRRTGGTKPFLFIGDPPEEESLGSPPEETPKALSVQATGSLYRLLHSRNKLHTGPLDMEPLEVLLQFIEDERFDTVAGPPQIVKVYSYANTLPINVLWPMDEPEYVAYFGRPLLGYEGSEYACYDLTTMELLSPYAARARVGE